MSFLKFWKKKNKNKSKEEQHAEDEDIKKAAEEAGFKIPIPLDEQERRNRGLNKTWSISRSGRYKVKKRERKALENDHFHGHKDDVGVRDGAHHERGHQAPSTPTHCREIKQHDNYMANQRTQPATVI